MESLGYELIGYWWEGDYVLRNDCLGNGSSNRYVGRMVMQEETSGRCFLLEGVKPEQQGKRRGQAELLAVLKTAGVPKLSPWLQTRTGAWGVEAEGLFWQCRTYIPCVELPRDSYVQDAWRGSTAAQWLNILYHAGRGTGDVFYITEYVPLLLFRIARNNPALYEDLQEVWKSLNFTLEQEKALPVVLCHGDYHPGNILWGEGEIQAVIDWEFCGAKPICYDAANLLGCIGMDNPDWLESPMATAFLAEIELPAMARRMLQKYMVALRFAWMREWWQARDREMMIQELDFMWLLLEHIRLPWEKTQQDKAQKPCCTETIPDIS